jgi:hypothetical protein
MDKVVEYYKKNSEEELKSYFWHSKRTKVKFWNAKEDRRRRRNNSWGGA